MSTQETVEELREMLEKLTIEMPAAIKAAYYSGVTDTLNDNLSNPPAVLWARSEVKRMVEDGL